jgi:hypothetical protein
MNLCGSLVEYASTFPDDMKAESCLSCVCRNSFKDLQSTVADPGFILFGSCMFAKQDRSRPMPPPNGFGWSMKTDLDVPRQQ